MIYGLIVPKSTVSSVPKSLALALSHIHLRLQIGRALVDELKLGEMPVQHSHNLRKLQWCQYYPRQSDFLRQLTGSSGLLVLLMVAEASLISSIMLVKSLPISSSLSDTRSAIL